MSKSGEAARVTVPVDPARSKIMAAVGQRDTKPEMIVRRLCHMLGYRYRLHVKTLPGSPDLVFPRLKKVIFVHGCFWHRHQGCRYATTPKTRQEFWKAKFDANIERDLRQLAEISALGWSTLVVWECETRDARSLRKKLENYLDGEDEKPV